MEKPKIRFGQFNDKWKKNKLDTVVDFFDNQRIPIDSGERKAGPYPYYGASGIIDFVDGYIFNGEYVLLAEDGANIILRSSPIAYLTKGKFWLNNHAHIMKMKTGSNEFLIQLLEKQNYEKYNTGTAQPKLNGEVVKKISLHFPSDEEQSSIGSHFRTLDELLASYKDNLANYQSLKATMISKMFPKAGQTVPEIRLDGFEGEWEVQTLKELASFSKGNGYTKNDLVNSGEEIILYGRLYTNYQTVISKVNTFVTTVKANAVISKGGEVIVPASGESAEDISRASVVDKSGVILGGDLNIIYPDENKVDSIFLALTISNGSQQKELIKRAQGKSIVHLRNNDLEKVVLHYPSLKEQQAIGSYFSNLDNLIAAHQEKISQLETLKKKLLQDMFI